MAKANRYRSASGEPTLTDKVRLKIEKMEMDTLFSLADFIDIPTNVSSALAKLAAQGEITLVGRKKVVGTRVSRNLYRRNAIVGYKELTCSCMGWENVYPEFFTLPKFNIIQVIQVGERL